MRLHTASDIIANSCAFLPFEIEKTSVQLAAGSFLVQVAELLDQRAKKGPFGEKSASF